MNAFRLGIFLFVTVNHTVNRPQFSSHIKIQSGVPSKEVVSIDVSAMNDSVQYTNETLEFSVLSDSLWTTMDEYYITFEEAVLFSDSTSNSSARTDPQFWKFKVTETTEPMSSMSLETSTQTPTTNDTTTATYSATSTQQPSNTTTVKQGRNLISSITALQQFSFSRWIIAGSIGSPRHGLGHHIHCGDPRCWNHLLQILLRWK